MDKTILVILLGDKQAGQTNYYQLLQEETALAEGRRAGLNVEVVFAAGFDHLRVIRRRLGEGSRATVDAVVVEPATVSSTELLLKELKGRAGLVLLNVWTAAIEQHAGAWGAGLPFGTISTDHRRIGEIQGRQVAALLPAGGLVLCVTGPLRSPAATLRLEGLRAAAGPALDVRDTEAGQWTEADGMMAFHNWYRLHKHGDSVVGVVAAQNDELAMGAMSAARAVAEPLHAEAFRRAKFLGVDACPQFGQRLVDDGRLAASIATPPNAGAAVGHLARFWTTGRALPINGLSEPQPYPAGSVGA